MEPDSKTSVMIIYTGGTIGMIKDKESGILLPFDFELIAEHIPELQNFDFRIECAMF
jgi:L-asparaginase